ncbi:MAG: YdeI/OmpD-associated family protein [Bacteroidota bacterium]|nr:YdeI/OmpD-associated family protein [Bacteroidota bacterium]
MPDFQWQDRIMVEFTATLKQFAEQGEKTGWTYLEVPADIAQQLKPGNKKSFRVKGKLDNFSIAHIALLPMGGGIFIMAVNATMRKGIGKKKGAMVKVKLEEDKKAFQFNKDFIECLGDEPAAMDFFKTLPGSHQRYFSKWIDGAKTEPTKTKRIAWAITALSKKQGYGEMLRSHQKKDLL